ncbi:ABC-ATPase domain-containing protein [Spirulina sp. CS-785/01]|uniref:ABC-ATPase domain-containing protein n=1 Tax=Spirulina sp. CS-785/01 TaxID=3021716 RepID=UPI00233003CA|nr:ABC-ATPase domain-containing protein [Spirulina sp. CS-785/01]MDB9312237.1 ABC-ATPase domain-containing protein [Spirulina sp. CS-785/01]
MPSSAQLRSTLNRLDNASYKAYKDIKGSYDFEDFTLIIDHVQGDPFAAPSKFRVKVPQSLANFPPKLFTSPSREIALRDFLTRQFDEAAKTLSSRRGTGKSGLIAMAKLGQEVLDRTATFLNDKEIEVRFVVGLPARGRRILGRQAAELICEDIPEIVDRTLFYDSLNPKKIRQQVETVEDADYIRSQLPERGLVAFVANGAILPRRSGVDDRPLKDNAIPFQSPPSLEVEFDCPNQGKITGMGIPQGITLIVGGGYHGKSTLLRAIEVGVYNHLPNDGREFVVTDPHAVKIRAEDGRSIAGVNISPFINQLPQNRSTQQFSTPNASGSTSQAANIMEALEVEAKVLLVDEDTAATNFMIRDHRMQQLIQKEKEPITPFIDKIRQLYDGHGVSTLLVMGGSGDYFDVADTVIAMDNFCPYEVTQQAKKIAEEHATYRETEGGEEFGEITPRIPVADSIDPSRGKRSVKLQVRDVDEVAFGTEDIDLSSVEQIVNVGQLRAIATALVYAKDRHMGKQRTIPEIIDRVLADIEKNGLDIITDYPQGDLAVFRRFELAAALNRLRSLEVE